ncbi:MAG TPA: hypothetical protein VF263_09850 [Longimicrobiaceae bacterium]
MKVLRAILPAAAAAVLLAGGASAQAGLTVRQKTTYDMGRIGSGELNQTLMVRGADRQKTVTQGRVKVLLFNRDASSTEVIRLDQGKVYRNDGRRTETKSIAEMRAELEKAQRDAERAAAGENRGGGEDVRFTVVSNGVQRTGQSRAVNGFQTQQQVLRMTVMAENTRTGEKAPVFHMTSDMWIDPSQRAAGRANVAFQNAYVAALGLDPRTAANPYGKYIRDLYREMSSLEGYPILTTITFEAERQQGQGGQAAAGGNQQGSNASAADQVRGALGGLMRRGRKSDEQPAAAASTSPQPTAPGRSVLFSSTTEVQSISTTAPAASEFEPPAG